MKVLVVDDEEVNLKSISVVLKGVGCNVVVTQTGVEAIEIINKGGIGIVFLDIVMPGLHGLDVLSRIKEEHREIIVVMMAYQREQALLPKAMQMGAFDFIRKPADKRELLQVVRKALSVQELSSDGHKKIKELEALKTGTLKLAEIKGQDITAESFFDSKVMLQTTLGLIAEVLDAERVSLVIIDESSKELRLVAASGFEFAGMGKERRKIGEGIAGIVAEKGEPILVKDIRSDPRFGQSEGRSKYKTFSFLCVPLRMKGKVVGVISVNDKKAAVPFNEADLSLLMTFSMQISLTIENAIMARDMKRQTEKLSLLTQINRALIEEADPKKVYKDIAQLGQKVLDAESCAIFLLEEGTEDFVCRGGSTGSEKEEGKAKFSMGQGVLGSVAKEGTLENIEDVSSHPKYIPDVDRLGKIPFRSLLATPINLKNRVLGILAAVNKTGDKGFSPRDLEIMESLALSASVALKNSWLHDNLVKTMDDTAKAEMEIEKLKLELQKK